MNKHFGIAILGGLILAAVTALPSLSHAMGLGLNLDSNVQVDLQNRHNDENSDTRFESETHVKSDITNDGKNNTWNEDRKDESTGQHDKNNKEDHPGFFGRIWSMFQGNTDKNHKEADDSSDVTVTASTTVDADASVDGPKIYWLRTSMLGSDSVSLVWISTEKTSSRVWIEKDDEVDTDASSAESDDSFTYFHKLKINDLEANTTYYFKVASTDKDGTTTISTLSSFTTKVE